MKATFRALLGLLAAAAMLPACGSLQNATMPQGVQAQSRAHRASGSSADLLYVLGSKDHANKWELDGFTFPGMQKVTKVHLKAPAQALCSDGDGNMFIPQHEAIKEYTHNGQGPIATLSDPGYSGRDCSVDSLSGNLAVTNTTGQQSVPGNVVIYRDATGQPTTYSDPKIIYYQYCTYDSSGNLFVVGLSQSGNILAELPKGSDTFVNITVDKSFYAGPVHWDGTDLVLQAYGTSLYRVSVSGSTGTVVGVTTLKDAPRRGINNFLIYEGYLAATGWKLGLWQYPKGGRPLQLFQVTHIHHLYGITISVAPSR